MAGEAHATETLGEMLAARRRRRFVGRAAEVELFRAALDAEPACSVLFLHGPGGVGKTSLLEVFVGAALAAGASVVAVDGRDLAPSPRTVVEALRAGGLEVPDGAGPIMAPAGRLVLLIDSYERLGAVDDWVRTRLLPRLPGTALTVIAARTAPGAAWRSDPAWRDLLRVVSVRNLSQDESRRYLRECGVTAALHEQLVAVSHGHPLALSLLADVAVRGGDVAVDPLAPDVVAALLRRFVEVVPSDLQRRALEVCALARVTTEPLLRAALGVDDAHELFAWLRGLSFVESGPEGLFPHDLARDVLDVDLRWRDVDGYTRVFRAVRSHIYSRLKSSHGREQQAAVFDLKFVFRNLPSVLSPVDWDVWGRHYPEPAHAEDHDEIVGLVAAMEGEASAAIAAHWLERQPAGFFVIREEEGRLRGLLGLLDLTAASAEDRAADPGVQAAWDYACQHAPLRAGEIVTQTRFMIDREAYQGPSPTGNAVPVVTIPRALQAPNLAWDFLTLAEPERWDDFFALADMPRAVGADFAVGGRRYGLYGHDFRVLPIDALLELWTERGLAQDFTPPPVRAREALVLSQPDFADAVRQALRDLHRPDLLARNPLVRARVVQDGAAPDEPDAAVLRGVVGEAIDSLRRHPRDDKLLRAVEATYLRPTRTQEAAAAALALPFSTYRRHLTKGVQRVVSWLWEREVYGSLSNGEQH